MRLVRGSGSARELRYAGFGEHGASLSGRWLEGACVGGRWGGGGPRPRRSWAFRAVQGPPGACRGLLVPSSAFQCLPVPSSAFQRRPVPSRDSQYLPVTSRCAPPVLGALHQVQGLQGEENAHDATRGRPRSAAGRAGLATQRCTGDAVMVCSTYDELCPQSLHGDVSCGCCSRRSFLEK